MKRLGLPFLIAAVLGYIVTQALLLVFWGDDPFNTFALSACGGSSVGASPDCLESARARIRFISNAAPFAIGLGTELAVQILVRRK